jgi:nitroreductase
MSAWKEILETAVLSPSPHNVQPWRVRVLSDGEADLFIERGRTLPKEDPTGSFIILTMGLFIEALTIAAANRSYALGYRLHRSPSEYTPEYIEAERDDLMPFARLTLEPDAAARGGYEDALFAKRQTSRVSLTPEPVPADAARALSELSHSWGQRYVQFADHATVERVLARNTDALFEDLNEPGYHDEIVEWFRFTSRQARRTRDGLDYRCMNSSRTAFWLAARFPKLLLTPLLGRLFRRLYRRQLGRVPTVAVLAGPFWRPEEAFETGRFLLRFWLETARHGLYLHPYGNLVTNKPAAEWCEGELGVPNVWLIFKIGFSAEPPRSYRRPVEEVLLA